MILTRRETNNLEQIQEEDTKFTMIWPNSAYIQGGIIDAKSTMRRNNY